MLLNLYIPIWIFINLIIIFILSGITIYLKGNIGYLPLLLLLIINICFYLFYLLLLSDFSTKFMQILDFQTYMY